MGEWADWNIENGEMEDAMTGPREETVELYVEEVLNETERAWLVRYPDSDVEEWWPKSQCELEGDALYVPEWLAEEKDCGGQY